MSYGLQVFDSSGNLEVDISSRLTRYVTTITQTVPANGSVHTYNYSVPGLTTDGKYSITLSSNLSSDFFLTTPLSRAAIQPVLVTDGITVWVEADYYNPIQFTINVFTL